MTTNEKKKILYKERPIANRLHSDPDHFHYWAETSAGAIHFKVPVSEMGELPFGETEQGQLLIRWIQ
jgi:hypothetical protein